MPPEQTTAYVTRDIEKALGMDPQQGYYIVTNRNPYSENIKKQHPHHVLLIESPTGESLGTADLLKQEKTLEFLMALRDFAGNAPHLVIFKNISHIEQAAAEQGWKLLNPPAALAEKIENKITQVQWLGDLSERLPAHRISLLKEVRWNNEPFVLQWAHGYTGEGTVLIRSEAELESVARKFPERKARATAYIHGPSFTVNAVVGANKTLQGNVSYQITGVEPFTKNQFTTVGNDWKLARVLLSEADNQAIASMVQDIGAKMRRDSWRGLFGLDFIKDTATGRLFLIEINARQPASTTYESQMQRARRTKGAKGMTTFEAHLAALFGQPLGESLIEITDGAQVVQRITHDMKQVSEDTIGSLELSGYTVIPYPNTEENADLIRIQSEQGIMADHGTLNQIGREIRDTLTYEDLPLS
jgi:hypothetical protein